MRVEKGSHFTRKFFIFLIMILFAGNILFADNFTSLNLGDKNRDILEAKEIIEEYLATDSYIDFSSDDNPTWQVVGVQVMIEFWQMFYQELTDFRNMTADEICALSDRRLETLFGDFRVRQMTLQEDFSLLPANFQNYLIEDIRKDDEFIIAIYYASLLTGVVAESLNLGSYISSDLNSTLEDCRIAYPDGCNLRSSSYDLFREYVMNISAALRLH